MEISPGDETPPEVLYHYTSAHGFYGIVKKRALWLTHIRYLNDLAEFHHAVAEALDHLDEKLPVDKFDERLRQALRTRLDTIPPADYFVGSFSQDGDLLSQWRSYSDEASGFSVGFRPRDLMPHIKQQGVVLRRCIYDPEEKSALLSRTLEGILLSTAGREDDDSRINLIVDRFMDAFLRLAPIFKAESFREELEWRVYIGPLSMTHPRVEFRKGSSMIIPYFELKLGGDKKPLEIARVIIGPNSHKELSKASAEAYLLKNGVRCETTQSEIPFRQW